VGVPCADACPATESAKRGGSFAARSRTEFAPGDAYAGEAVGPAPRDPPAPEGQTAGFGGSPWLRTAFWRAAICASRSFWAAVRSSEILLEDEENCCQPGVSL
jgi:hypothetical protein